MQPWNGTAASAVMGITPMVTGVNAERVWDRTLKDHAQIRTVMEPDQSWWCWCLRGKDHWGECYECVAYRPDGPCAIGDADGWEDAMVVSFNDLHCDG